MTENATKDETRDGPATKFYLPAVTRPSASLERFEGFVEELFDFHGVVLIPESYNK